MPITEDFFKYQAQTSPHPLGLQISYAEGSYIYDLEKNSYLDFVAGISACSLGHRHPKVVEAIKQQLDKYMHLMVYGEYIQEPAVEFSKLLAQQLPYPLKVIYLTNSGTEATEGALKLAKRATGRTQLISANSAYHGSTQGAMSVMGVESKKQAYKPLLPHVDFIQFNRESDLEKITEKTAGVILESIQGGAGFIVPTSNYLKKVQERCNQVGALFIIDEIQAGFGRTAKLFGFQHYDIVPDILIVGKGMGGGMPVGAFVASEKHMKLLQTAPKLGHITTFGGHPVIAAACLATLKTLLNTGIIPQTIIKETLIRSLLKHSKIKEIRGKGLMLALIMESSEIANQLIIKCKEKGLVLFWLLFEPRAVRITPPLTISEKEIRKGCNIILEVLRSI